MVGMKSILPIKRFQSYVFKCTYDFKCSDFRARYWKLSIHRALYSFFICHLSEDIERCNFLVCVHAGNFCHHLQINGNVITIMLCVTSFVSSLWQQMAKFLNFLISVTCPPPLPPCPAGKSERMGHGYLTYLLILEPHCATAPLLAESASMLLKPVDLTSSCEPQGSVTVARSWATST